MSEYRLQIVRASTGHVVKTWMPGGQIETDLVDELVRRVKEKGIAGVFKTEAKTLTGIREAFGEMLHDLKRRV